MRDEVERALAVISGQRSGDRVRAVDELLQRLGLPGDVEVLGQALAGAMRDTDPLVRIKAAEALAASDLIPWQRPLIAALLHDENATVRACAAESLGDAGNREGLAALRSALDDEDEAVRSFAAMSLGLVGELPDAELLRRLAHGKGCIDERIAFISGACRLDARIEDVEELLQAIETLTDEDAFGPLNELEDFFARDPPALVRREAVRFRKGFERLEARASPLHQAQFRKLYAILEHLAASADG